MPLFELIAQILCAVEIARTNAVFINRQKCFCFYLGDSHVVSLLGMTMRAIDFIAMPFEQWCAVSKAKIKFGSRQHARFACCRCLGDEQYSACAKGAPTKQIILRNCGRRFCPSCFDSKDSLRGRKAKIKFGSRQYARFACCRCQNDGFCA